jgi:hypothetical protein
MATKNLARHGSEAGYREELKTGSVCERCRNGHRQFDKQYKPSGKKQGLKYTRFDVIDHLYRPGRARVGQSRAEHTASVSREDPPESPREDRAEQGQSSDLPDFTLSAEPTEPSLADRIKERLSGFTYVESGEMPDYLTTVTPDPDPDDPDSTAVKGDEFVVTQKNMELIQDNMGTYLSVVSMTLSLADPYCAPSDDEIDALVKRWSKVVSRYPRAAKLFMSEGGGIIMDWIGAIQATWPILFRLYEHHLAGTVKTEKGRIYRVTPNGSGPTVDSTMPPIPDSYYTVGQ